MMKGTNHRMYISNETRDFLIAGSALVLAFVVATYVGRRFTLAQIPEIFLTAVVTVVLAFVAHELAHRYVANRIGGLAFFRKWNLGVGLILLTSLLGVLFATPGAVRTTGVSSGRNTGIVALAGPLTNMIVAAVAYTASIFLSGGLIGYLLISITRLNAWFGFFNMIPFPPIDGSKVILWNRGVFAVSILAAFALTYLSGFF